MMIRIDSQQNRRGEGHVLILCDDEGAAKLRLAADQAALGNKVVIGDPPSQLIVRSTRYVAAPVQDPEAR